MMTKQMKIIKPSQLRGLLFDSFKPEYRNIRIKLKSRQRNNIYE